jgi:hypothetical protein
MRRGHILLVEDHPLGQIEIEYDQVARVRRKGFFCLENASYFVDRVGREFLREYFDQRRSHGRTERH